MKIDAPDRLPLESRRSDVDVAHDASVALLDEPSVPDRAVNVRVLDGWMWLLGTVDREDQRRAAERAVQRTPGIRGVTNLVRLTPLPRPAANIAGRR